MFVPNDIYTSSGSVKLYHCWTDRVTHYDSSSFYNWEQDDLPVYDLEERTHYLWEQLGYPTSSIPGVALVVSADAPASSVDCNKNIFRSLSAAIDSLPQTINFPVLIEVANFGQLGELNIDGKKAGPRGSIEIINRNFTHAFATASGPGNGAFFLTPPTYAFFGGGGVDSDSNNWFYYLSSVVLNNPIFVDPTNLYNITPLIGLLQASCMSISAAVYSATFDPRLSGEGSLDPKLNAYISMWKERSNYNRATMVIDDHNTVNPYVNNYAMAFKSYDLNPNSSDDVHNKDASSLNPFTETLVGAVGGWQGYTISQHFNGLYYGNKLSKASIRNTSVPVYIRNFFLDGSGSSRTDNNVGFEVLNSPNVHIENTVSTRYRKAGFKFVNSSVKILRGCVASRIYDFDSSGVRVTEPYINRRQVVTQNSASSLLRDDGAAGIHAINSEINFSSTHKWEEPLVSALLGGAKVFIPSYYILEFTKCTNGMILENSVVTGGKSQDLSGVPYPSYFETCIDFAHNTGNGIKSFNSKISLDGRLRVIENLNGMDLQNSVLEFDKFHALGNQYNGIKASNSNILYNKNLVKNHTAGSLYDTYTHPIYFFNNGQHINLNRSDFKPFITSSMEEIYGRVAFRDPIGKLYSSKQTVDGFGQMESVRLDNGSNAIFISPVFLRDNNYSLPNNPAFAVKGSELHVTNNSTAELRGTKYYATRLFGPSGYDYNRHLIGAASENNSTIFINGPTVIAQYGVDLLAENNSKIQLSPSRNSLDNTFDISSINLSDAGNHTAVELHAVRSCVVVDKNSNFIAKDLGNFVTTWERSGDLSSLTNSGLDYEPVAVDLQLFTSGGSLQFYPNPTPPLNADYGSFLGQDSPLNVGNLRAQEAFNTSLIGTKGQYYLLSLATTPLGFSAITYGGVCVKALNNSVVEVNNVNFPCGHWNASAPYYDGTQTFTSGGACYRPFIWNIADNSQLKASFLSVSGLYPNRAGYVGPPAYWTSGSNAASAMPSSTPDTSTLSVLDLYGYNPSGHAFFSASSATNYGPFRLYFGIDSFANTLVNLSGQGYGIIPQIYAQGYQPSSNLLCSGSVSALYKQALQRDPATGVINPSGYYYGEDIVTNPGFLRVFVDQSAAETFANAKHCSAGKSNAAKIVSIYLPYDQVNFGDSATLYGIPSLNMFDAERYN